MQPHHFREMLIATIQPRLAEQATIPRRAEILEPNPKWAPKRSYLEAEQKNAALFNKNAESKKARATHDLIPFPPDPEEDGSDSESTLEREQNEIAEK